jgi:rare lipoprotein A (peptidoglycan hydrolase)
MMRTAFTKKVVVVVLLAAPVSLAASAARALAGAGGVTAGGVSSSESPAAAHRRAPRRAGLATWFGPGFYGRRTACGQTLTPTLLGLAHRTLPCGTLVNVTFRQRHLTLPVIDRGPYADNGAEWDLTTQAARALGMQDTARIAARVVGSARNSPTLGVPTPVPVLTSTGGASAG